MSARRDMPAADAITPRAPFPPVAGGRQLEAVPRPRLYRRDRDSSKLAKPRIFTRAFCEPVELLSTVRFYEALAGERLDQDLDLSASGIHVVAVGPFLILALDAAKLDHDAHQEAGATQMTVLAASLDRAIDRARALGAFLVDTRFSAPHATGQRMRHPEGTLVEYLQHRPSEFDVDTPSSMFR